MLLVVDANIVFSSLIGGKLTDLFLSAKLELVAPELLFVEMRKHKGEIMKKSHLSKDEFEILLAILERRIKIIPLPEFASFISEAEKLLEGHLKDAPYLALALKLKCPVWSHEKLFKTTKGIDCLTTPEIAKRIKVFDSMPHPD